jgi:hypothetical protein
MLARKYWTDDELAKLKTMLNEGMSLRVASIKLGRGPQAAKKKLLEGRPNRRRVTDPSGVGYVSAMRAPEIVVERRRQYLAAPHRSLTAALMGDPPVGFSALDKRDS